MTAAEITRQRERLSKCLSAGRDLMGKMEQLLDEMDALLGGKAGIGETLRQMEAAFDAAWGTRYSANESGRYIWNFVQDRAQMKADERQGKIDLQKATIADREQARKDAQALADQRLSQDKAQFFFSPLSVAGVVLGDRLFGKSGHGFGVISIILHAVFIARSCPSSPWPIPRKRSASLRDVKASTVSMLSPTFPNGSVPCHAPRLPSGPAMIKILCLSFISFRFLIENCAGGFDDFLGVRQKSLVEHLIGLVEYQKTNVI